jgi:hypothetical protein
VFACSACTCLSTVDSKINQLFQAMLASTLCCLIGNSVVVFVLNGRIILCPDGGKPGTGVGGARWFLVLCYIYAPQALRDGACAAHLHVREIILDFLRESPYFSISSSFQYLKQYRSLLS